MSTILSEELSHCEIMSSSFNTFPDSVIPCNQPLVSDIVWTLSLIPRILAIIVPAIFIELLCILAIDEYRILDKAKSLKLIDLVVILQVSSLMKKLSTAFLKSSYPSLSLVCS